MPTKGILNRQRVSNAIVASAETHAQIVGERLNADFASIVLEGEPVPDFVVLKRQLARYLQMQTDNAVLADEAHLQEIDDDRDPRVRRDEAADNLYQKLIEMRETLSGLLGSENATAFVGIDGTTSRDPLTLHRLATRVLERLRSSVPELPPIRLAGIQVDALALAEELQPATTRLETALAEVERESRETETTLEAKTTATEALDRAIRGIGRIVKGIDELAAFPRFAEKVRLTRTARGGPSGAPEGSEEPTNEEETPSADDEQDPESPSPLGFSAPFVSEPPDPSPD